VGVGLIAAGKPVFGWHHPEGGHIRISTRSRGRLAGNCRFHGACVEGLASGQRSSAQRHTAANLPADSPYGTRWRTRWHNWRTICFGRWRRSDPDWRWCGQRADTSLSPDSRVLASEPQRLRGHRASGWRARGIHNAARLGTLAGPLGALASRRTLAQDAPLTERRMVRWRVLAARAAGCVANCDEVGTSPEHRRRSCRLLLGKRRMIRATIGS